jgi:hypothetical protein
MLVLGLLTTVLAVSGSRVEAQDMPGMNHGKANIIDGSKNPEQIQDKDAYRMFLLATINHTGSEEEGRRQLGLFQRLGLTNEQIPQVQSVIAEFAVKNNILIDAYNAQAEATVSHAGYKAFRQQQTALVLETEAKIELILGINETQVFRAFIQSEKRNMKIAVE